MRMRTRDSYQLLTRLASGNRLLLRTYPRVLENPELRPRASLDASKLFNKSSLACLLDRLSTDEKRKISFGRHSVRLNVDRGGRVLPYGRPQVGEDPRIEKHSKSDHFESSRWFYHSNSLVNIGFTGIDQRIREELPHGYMWTGACENAIHRGQALDVKHLKPENWPRDPLGPAWPSYPSITEWLGMLRCGFDPFERGIYSNPESDLGFTQVTRREVHENHVLATRIITNNFVGIRSTTAVPRKFLKYFRYSQNFLILVVRHDLPIGLIRFLISRWCMSPFSLWLRRAVLFKTFLKKVPSSLVKQARLRLDAYASEARLPGSGSCTPTDGEPTEYYSDGSSDLD